MYTNADTLTNKFEELIARIKEHSPSIVCVTEVKPKHMKGNLLNSEFSLKKYGYEQFPLNLENDTGRGMVVYTREFLHVTRSNLQSDFSEVILLEIQLQRKDTLLFGCFYRNGSGSSQNNNNMRNLLNSIVQKNFSHICLVGDFNYPSINWETWQPANENEESEEYKLIECLRENYLSQHVTQPTRVRGTDEPSTLDLIITNDERLVQEIQYTSPLGKSDHATIKFDLRCYSARKAYMKKKYFYDKADYSKMKQDLQSINWRREMEDINDVNTMWNRFHKQLMNIQEQGVPNKMVLQNPHKRWDVPMDSRLRGELKRKHRLWTRHMERRSEASRREYCKARNKVSKLTKWNRKKFEKDLASQAKKNPKAIWNYIQSKSKVKEGIADLKIQPEDPNSPTTTDDKAKANILAEFFSSVFTVEPDGQMPVFESKQCLHEMPAVEITEEMIEKHLKELNPSKTPGPDNLHPRLLKELASELKEPLCLIFKKSLTNGVIPDIWKKARISAIYKNKGSRKVAGNYRPVSLTSIVCKTFEKIIRENIIEHFKRNQLFTKKQYGFLNGRSTSLQLLTVLDLWTMALQDNLSIDCIYMDFQKAFDKVPHKRLLKKIESYGIHASVQTWIKDFLSDRSQQVTVCGEESNWKRVTSGIPQGSVLGPLLFVIYINDLPDAVSSTPYIFADDTKIFRIIKDESDEKSLQDDLWKLEKWSSDWLLKFHPEKCKHMRIGDSENICDYVLGNHDLQKIQTEKDIGVYVDNKLEFDVHISEKIKKASSMLALLRRTFQFLDKETFPQLYMALVRVHLESQSSVWCPYKKKYIDSLEKVQRRATRMLPGMADKEYEERLKILQIPSLTYRRLRGDMLEVYKMTSGEYDPEVIPKLQFVRNSTTRGHSKKLFHQRSTHSTRRNFFSNRIIPVWNSLPEEIVSAPNKNTFKNRLDKFWENQPMKFRYREPYLTGTGLRVYLAEDDS